MSSLSKRILIHWMKTHTPVRFLLVSLLFSNASLAQADNRIRVLPDFDQPGFSMVSEFNIYQGALFTNAFVEYLTEDGWDLGINTFNIPISGNGNGYGKQYDTYLNISKFFFPAEDWIIAIGTQSGTHFSGKTRHLHNFEFAEITHEWDDWLKFTSGAYYVNNALSQTRQDLGALVGIDIMFVSGVFWTEMDWFSGCNNISGAVVNNYWQATDLVTIYAGIQLPAAQSGNSFAGIIGFALDLDDPDATSRK